MGRAGPRPMRCGLYMGRSALPMRRPTCFHGPVRVAAHEMCTTASTIPGTTITSILPVRRPTCFHRPARAAAHEMWCTTLLRSNTIYQVLLQQYSTTTSALPVRRPPGVHAPRHGPAHEPVPKRAKERFTTAMRYFPDPQSLVHTRYQVKVGTTT